MSGITTVCFAASYAVALALELTRLMFRSSVRGVLLIGFAAAGFFAQTVYLIYRAHAAEMIPLSSAHEWYLLAAWMLVATYLYLSVFQFAVASGLFILPLTLALIAASRFASDRPIARSPAVQAWGAIHGVFWLLGAVAVMIGFVAGMMYLWQSYRIKHKVAPPRGLKLPSLERLERVNSRAIVVSALMAGVGFLSGLILNIVSHQTKQTEVPWTDPIVWHSGGLFGWLLAAALFSGLYLPARRGHKVAYLTVASFAFLAVFFALQLSGSTEHGGQGSPEIPTRSVSEDLWSPASLTLRVGIVGWKEFHT